MRKTQLGFGTLLATSLLTWNAFGQDAPPAEEPAPPPADPQPEAEPAPAPKAEAKVEAKVELDAKAKKKKAKKGGDDEDGEEGEEAVEGEDTGRFRGGVSGIIGVFLPGPVIQLGVEGRLGYQINDLMAVYGDIGSHAGFGVNVGASEDGGGASITAGAGIYGSAMFEVTLADVFSAALGPTLMYGSFVTVGQYVSVDAAEQSVAVFAGVLPGIKMRVGVGFGSERPGRRKQFTLAAQCSIL